MWLSLTSLLSAVASAEGTSRAAARRTTGLSQRLGLRALGDERTPQGPGLDLDVLTRTKTVTKPPPMFRVILYNDGRMNAEIVLEALVQFFNKTPREGMEIMMTAHRAEQASVGVYTREIAETRIVRAETWTRAEMERRFNLRNTIRLEAIAEDRFGFSAAPSG